MKAKHNNIDISNLVNLAYSHILYISDHIGSRQAGSKAEKDAFSYITDNLKRYGYATYLQPVLFAFLPRWFVPYGVGGLYLAICGLLITRIPFVAITAPLFFYFLPFFTRKAIRSQKKQYLSQNIFTSLPKPSIEKLLFILSAHVDTAKASYFRNKYLLTINYYSIFLSQRVAIAVSTFSLLILLNITIPDLFILFIQGLSIICGIWLFYSQLFDRFYTKGNYSKGANDNASAVSVLLSIAEELNKPHHRNALKNLDLGFLFTGAEETGCHGAETFASTLKGHNALLLCVDMVGCGNDLLYVTKDGTFMPTYSSTLINAYMKKVNPDISPIAYTIKSGDFALFCSNNIHASSIETKGKISQEIAYHTIYDTIDIIDKNTLEKVICFLIELVYLVNEHAHEVISHQKK